MRMRRTTDKLLSTEFGTIEQTLLFIEFYLFERFRITNLIKECAPAETERLSFLNKKLLEIEDKIACEKEDILIYEELVNECLTDGKEECKIYNISDYVKGEHYVKQ